MGFSSWLKNLIFSKKRNFGLKEKKYLKKRWQKIEEMVEEGGARNLEMAVIKADKLFGRALKSLGYDEDTWAESLAKAEDKFSKTALDGLWRAHRVRNRLVHDTDHETNSMEAKSAVKKFRRGMKELNIS